MSIERVGEGRPAVGPSLRSGGGVPPAVDAAETEVWDAASGDGLEGDANAV